MFKRVETFTDVFTREFTTEYARRANPNLPSSDRYRALQEIGELQRHVDDGTLERRDAIAHIERERLDEQAFKSVRKIAQNAAQDAFHESVPETEIVENPFQASLRRRNDRLSDLFKPRFSLKTSLSDRHITLEPVLRLGFYKVKFTDDDTFNHRLNFTYDNWYFLAGIEHHRDEIINANAGVSYALGPYTSIGVSYTFNREPDEDHRIALGFSTRF